jgi:hypothetical protein
MWQYVVGRKVLRPYDCVPTVWTNNIQSVPSFLIQIIKERGAKSGDYCAALNRQRITTSKQQ